MTLISSSRGERKSNQNLASFMGAPRSIVVCVLVPVLVLHMHDHFTVKLDNLPESSDARASPWSSLRCIYGIFESIFFRMTGRFNGPFVEIFVSAIIGASWLLGGTQYTLASSSLLEACFILVKCLRIVSSVPQAIKNVAKHAHLGY